MRLLTLTKGVALVFIEDWFEDLRQKVDRIEKEWATASTEKQEHLIRQLKQLRTCSDQVIDLWLKYEEKLNEAIRMIKQTSDIPASAAESLVKEYDKLLEAKQPLEFSTLLEDEQPQMELHKELYEKAEGFYHLRLYEQAKQHFASFLEQAPDWESGRLYYAYSLYYCCDYELALKEFRLLTRTAVSPKVVSISYNALGCMYVQEQKWLEAIQAFEMAISVRPQYTESRYNLAICYLEQGETEKTMKICEQLLAEHDQDWEVEVLYLRAVRQLFARYPQKDIERMLKMYDPNRNLDSPTLWELAMLAEQAGFYRHALSCYQFLLERQPLDAGLWHAIAWNKWLLDGPKQAMPALKKALTLAPEHPDYLFSYGWMQLATGEITSARIAFSKILNATENHHLGLLGLIYAHEGEGAYDEAKDIATTLIQKQDQYSQMLGHYQLGKLSLQQGNQIEASQYLEKARSYSDVVPEVNQWWERCKNTKDHVQVTSQTAGISTSTAEW
nr:tetratricopeptide repeat protein [Brevibacillus halotolerans]